MWKLGETDYYEFMNILKEKMAPPSVTTMERNVVGSHGRIIR